MCIFSVEAGPVTRCEAAYGTFNRVDVFELGRPTGQGETMELIF